MKLQNAYITEAAKLGSFGIIGYEMASTTNFTYTDKLSVVDGTAALPAAAAESEVWQAKANVALNDCQKDSEWMLRAKGVANSSGVDYTGSIGNGAASTSGNFEGKCLALTNGFKSIADNN